MNALTNKLAAIGLKAIEADRATLMRKAARQDYLREFEEWKYQRGITERITADDSRWPALCAHVANTKAGRAYVEAQRNEKNAKARLASAIRRAA
ncbi:MAG: hypothetical protein QM581_06480 [Pseudomonas sp.]